MRHRRLARHPAHRTRDLRLEVLEGRQLLATITVNTTADDSTADTTLSLREAIEVANGTLDVGSLSTQEQAQVSGALSNPNTIGFNIPGAGVQTIVPATDLPTITSPVIIDGYTQPGSSPNTNPVTTGINAVPLIQLSAAVPLSGTGLLITAGSSTVRGLVINGFQYGISLQATPNQISFSDTIAGNFIGTDPSGTIAMKNGAGLFITNASRSDTIGGLNPADRNLISGNSDGGITGLGDFEGIVIQGNFIGTDITGTKALGNGVNGSGVNLVADVGLGGVTIGGTAAGARNLISGNAVDGIALPNVIDSVIQGNFIGTDVTGTKKLGNNVGVFLNQGQDTTVGGTAPGAGNVISGASVGPGLQIDTSINSIIQGNFIGTDVTGTLDLGNFGGGIVVLGQAASINKTTVTIGSLNTNAGNTIAFNAVGNPNPQGGVLVGPLSNTLVTIQQNSIFGNNGAGIMSSTPLTPVLTGAVGTGIAGTLSGPANDSVELEFFATPNESNQGKTLLGELGVNTDGTGHASFTFSRPGGFPAGQFITATATDSASGTSAFSNGFQIPAQTSSPDLSLLGTAPSTVAQGSNVTYTLTIANGGNAAATGVTLIDTVPANVTFVSATGGATPLNGLLTFSLGTLAAGVTAPTITIVVTANAAGTLTNLATVNGNETDPTPTDNNITQSTTVQAAATGADLSLVGTAPASVLLGNTVTYTLTVANAGPTGTEGVTLTDTLPAGVTFVSATGGVSPVNGVLTFRLGNLAAHAQSVTETVVVTTTATGILNNTARVSGDAVDPSLADNALSQNTVVNSPPPVSADLALQGTAVGSVILGQNVTYTLTVANTGPSGATGVKLVDVLPAGGRFVSATGGVTPVNGLLTFNLGNFAANGAAITETIVVTPTSAGSLRNTASVSGNQADPTSADNALVQTTFVNAPETGNGPVVLALQRFGFHSQPTVIALSFNGPLDASRAQLTGNYRIVGPGGQTIGVDSAVYDPALQTVTLHPHSRLNVHHPYQLTIVGTGALGLTDTHGRLLDGARAGHPGSDYLGIVDMSVLVRPASHPRGPSAHAAGRRSLRSR